VLGATDAMRVMQDEIFGPILPVLTYRDLDEALAYINDRDRPLALYLFDRDRRRIREVLERTVAGGVTVNDTILHIAQDELPFGGIGASGMGQYHGHEGFLTFSKLKPVFYQARLNGIGLFAPPYGARFERLLKVLLRRPHVANSSRPAWAAAFCSMSPAARARRRMAAANASWPR
jgi:hypothetical protein